MTSLLNTTRNLSFCTVPAAWVLCIAPHIYAVKLYDWASPVKKFDKVNPRTLLASLDANDDLEGAIKERIRRAEAAQLNGYENLGFFAAAVVAANVAKVDPWWTDTLSAGFLASRVLFNILYITGVKGQVRGTVFYFGIG